MIKQSTLATSVARARSWAISDALPLWASAGFDKSTNAFEEILAWDHRAVENVSRRVMVQARQISAYALATDCGWFDGRDLVLQAGAAMINNYWAADGRPGWVFSLHRDGRIDDQRRDLYANAFVLFALSWMIRLSPDPKTFEMIDRTIEFLDVAFADPEHGGYWDSLPRVDHLRRQNPHMHLLEAFLQLAEFTGNYAYLDRATALVALAKSRFVGGPYGTVREVFDDAWLVSLSGGGGGVEPGHQFEWAWLLRRFDCLTGSNSDQTISLLVEFALTHGTDTSIGRIVNELSETGRVVEASSRLWPHAEAIKSLAVEAGRGMVDANKTMGVIITRLMSVYCTNELKGGWVDRVDEADKPLSREIPASSLYHIIFAVYEADKFLKKTA